MSLLKRLVKNVKRAARKVLRNPVIGGVVSAIAPPLAPVIRTANTISAAAGLGARRPPPPPPPSFSLPPPSMAGIGGSMSLLPVVAGGAARVLPGLGRVAGGVFRSPTVRGAVGGAAGAALFDAFGNPVRPRRRSRGFSARDIRQARRIVRLANDFSCPGSRMRKAGKKCR